MEILSDIPAGKFFLLFFVVAVFVAAVSLRRRNSHGGSRINFDDLLTDYNGRMDPARCMAMGTWTVMTMVVVNGTVTGTLNEGIFAVYAGSLLPIFAKAYQESSKQSVPAVQVEKVEVSASVAPAKE